MWIGLMLMTIQIQIWIGINMGIWILISIKTMPIHNTREKDRQMFRPMLAGERVAGQRRLMKMTKHYELITFDPLQNFPVKKCICASFSIFTPRFSRNFICNFRVFLQAIFATMQKLFSRKGEKKAKTKEFCFICRYSSPQVGGGTVNIIIMYFHIPNRDSTDINFLY